VDASFLNKGLMIFESVNFGKMWHAHLARDFTGKMPVPLTSTRQLLNRFESINLVRPFIRSQADNARKSERKSTFVAV